LLFDIASYDFPIGDHPLSVLHIPPSLNKPHVIRGHQRFKGDDLIATDPHRIFVRRGTTTEIATRVDIELMYYDRKNIVPEYELLSSFDLSGFVFGTSAGRATLTIHLTLENTGRRPISIVKLKCVQPLRYVNFIKEFNFSSVPAGGLIVEVGSIKSARVDFVSAEAFNDDHESVKRDVQDDLTVAKSELTSFTLEMILSTGKTIVSNCIISELRKL